jgi:hypothetical protein
MTGTATQSAQDTSQAAGGSGTSLAAGDKSTAASASTALTGGDQQQQQQAPVDQQSQASGEKKPDGEAKAGDDKGQQQQPAKAPEKYADFKMPDGIEADAKLIETATPVLRELGLDQDKAQKLVDVFAARQAEQSAEYAEQLKDDSFALEQVGAVLGHQRESWGAALKADKEIGGTSYDTNIKVAQRAIARFASPALKSVLEQTGLGNHPEFVRCFLKVGHMVSEDSTQLDNAAGSGQRKSDGDVFYGDQKAG